MAELGNVQVLVTMHGDTYGGWRWRPRWHSPTGPQTTASLQCIWPRTTFST